MSRRLTKEQRDELRKTAAEIVKERLHASAIVACRVEIPQLLDDLDTADSDLEKVRRELEEKDRQWKHEMALRGACLLELDELRTKLAEAEAETLKWRAAANSYRQDNDGMFSELEALRAEREELRAEGEALREVERAAYAAFPFGTALPEELEQALAAVDASRR